MKIEKVLYLKINIKLLVHTGPAWELRPFIGWDDVENLIVKIILGIHKIGDYLLGFTLYFLILKSEEFKFRFRMLAGPLAKLIQYFIKQLLIKYNLYPFVINFSHSWCARKFILVNKQ